MTIKPNKYSGSNSSIEIVNTQFLGIKDLDKIRMLEQETWADKIGEYLKCTNCDHIFSKKNIYGHLEYDIYKKPVSEIEKELKIDHINCPDCGGNTKHIYGEPYLLDIIDRYKNSVESFLTVYRSGDGEIRGFFDGYIDSFESLYKREFGFLGDNLENELLLNKIEKNIGNIPDHFLVCSALGMEEGYKDFNLLFLMMKSFFDNINNNYGNNYVGIAEVIIGSNTHGIYHSVGAERLGLSLDDGGNKQDNFESDIFIHKGIVGDYVNSMKGTVKDFLRNNRSKMKEVIIA